MQRCYHSVATLLDIRDKTCQTLVLLSLVLSHIWPISTTETTLTVHVVIADSTRLDDITYRLKEVLRTEGIAHSTLELETPASHCHSHTC